MTIRQRVCAGHSAQERELLRSELLRKMHAKYYKMKCSESDISAAVKRAEADVRKKWSTEENLAASFESEAKVAGVAYDDFIKLAEETGNKPASLYFSQSRDVEEIHAKLYKEAMDHVLEERQTTYYVCDVCGYVSDGVLPEECPI